MDYPISGAQRDEVARILEMVAKDGLDHPRNLDSAIDAIGAAFRCEMLTKAVTVDGEAYYFDGWDEDEAKASVGHDVEVHFGHFVKAGD